MHSTECISAAYVSCSGDAWRALASCFDEAAQRFKAAKGRPPVLVIDGAEFLMPSKPFVYALLTLGKVSLIRPQP